eukprot:g2462.t1
MIDSRTDKRGERYMAYNERRWGGDGWTEALRAKGRECGAPFNNWVWWPHTLDAHRLMHYASTRFGDDAADALKGALFNACYEQGHNISEQACLAKVGAACLSALRDEGEGAPTVTEGTLSGYLASDDGRAEVQRECREASRSGVTGVPFFLVSPAAHLREERPYGFSGAQEPEFLLQVFNEIARQ